MTLPSYLKMLDDKFSFQILVREAPSKNDEGQCLFKCTHLLVFNFLCWKGELLSMGF